MGGCDQRKAKGEETKELVGKVAFTLSLDLSFLLAATPSTANVRAARVVGFTPTAAQPWPGELCCAWPHPRCGALDSNGTFGGH